MMAINLLLLLISSSCTAFIISPLKLPTKKYTTNSNTYLTAKKNDGLEKTINRRDVLQHASSIIAATSILNPSISSASDNDDLAYLGPLASLVGTWSGNGGLSITGVPSRKSNPDAKGEFELIVRPYKEELTFEAIPGAVKQRGGSTEQFSGVVTYKKKVYATDDTPELIHVEDGMLFFLDNVEPYSDGTPSGKVSSKDNKQPCSIARSATVPHGNSAMLFGNSKTSNGGPTIPNIDARPVPTIDGIAYDSPYTTSKYNAVNPNVDLQKVVSDQTITKTTHIALDSRNGGGVTNTAYIGSRAPTTGFKCDFWVETVKGKNGKVVEQLQYSEFVDIFFHRTETGGKGDLINWPHVMINTLTKEV